MILQELNTSKGIKLSTPGYDGYDETKGGVTTYPPGAKENGGIFNHTQGWGVMAECLLGHGDRAYEYYRAFMPAAYNERAEVRQIEPYVQGQCTYSPNSPRAGNARTSWLTGTAAWASGWDCRWDWRWPVLACGGPCTPLGR